MTLSRAPDYHLVCFNRASEDYQETTVDGSIRMNLHQCMDGNVVLDHNWTGDWAKVFSGRSEDESESVGIRQVV